MSMVGLKSYAYEIVRNGIYYDFSGSDFSVTYISSSYSEEEGHNIYESNYSGNIVIPSHISYYGENYPVTKIGDHAFYGCEGLSSVIIPNTVTRIEEEAFYGCSSLESITIPSSVKYIEYNAFRLGYVGEEVTVLSINITDLKAWCEFDYFDGIGRTYCLCLNGELITDLIIPDGVISIPGRTFSNCVGFTSITIPEGITTIGDYAFACSMGDPTTYVTIPSSVVSIGYEAFSRSFDSNKTIIISNLSAWCNIDDENSGLCENDYSEYDSYRLYLNEDEITNLTIPDDVTSIRDRAFLNCSSITSATISNSVTSIGDYAFYGCSGLNSVNIKSVNPVSIYSNTFSNSTNATLYVPYGCKAAYEAANYWKEFKELVENNTVNVGSSGFATYCSPNALDFSDVSAIKAYIASGFNPTTGTLVLTRVTEVTAGEGLYIVGEEGSYEIPETTTDMFYLSLLKGVISATTISPTDGSYTNFILSNGSHGIGFYTLSAEGEISAGKAYLQLPTACVAGVKAFKIVFDDYDDYATGVNSVGNNEKIEFIYNLKGERVLGPKKGLYIINGKKRLIQ